MQESSQPSDQDHKKNIKSETHLIFLPGLHGTAELFNELVEQLKLQAKIKTSSSEVSFQTTLINYPQDLKQSYKKLFKWLSSHLALDQTTESTNSVGPKTVIIAESFSTPLALKLADQFPQQISAVVIAAGFCASPAYPGFALLPLRPLFMLAPPRAAVRHFLIGPESSVELVNKVRSVIKNVSAKCLSQRMRSILTLEEEQTPTIPKTPVLLLQAEHDAVIPWEIQNQLEQHLPHAETHWIDSPHLIMQAQPETCAKHITEFLDNI